jgi:polynucleotide 5'-hydroxyl-kinase GRC3/NOL9
MSQDWAEKVAQQLLSRGLIQTGTCLILGAADTGKTTLAAAMAKHVASSRPVGIIDADIGQSHIGPPTTVGWAVVDNPQIDFSQLAAGGISFVGDITPVGHLLQLTAAIIHCVQQASEVAKLIIVDTPGFIRGPAATALWWTVQRILKPKLILAVQRSDELSDILAGLRSAEPQLEPVKSPPQIPTKSPQDRQRYRQSQFNKYFRDSCLYNISLSNVAVQVSRNLSRESLIHRLVALRNEKGTDIAIGLITNGNNDRDIVAVRAPKIDIRQIRCLIIGDVTIEIEDG